MNEGNHESQQGMQMRASSLEVSGLMEKPLFITMIACFVVSPQDIFLGPTAVGDTPSVSLLAIN